MKDIHLISSFTGGARIAVCGIILLCSVAAYGVTCTYRDGGWDNTPSSAEDAVVIESGNLTWDAKMPMKVASWNQGAQYDGVVTFDTGLETFEVTGDVSLLGGVWTHTKNPTGLSKNTQAGMSGRGEKQLIVSVGGNFTLTKPAKIDVTAMGYYGGEGPGSSKNWASGSGSASHGGTGAIQDYMYANERSIAPGYGSVKRPDTLGSGGSSSDEKKRGGGAVRLTVGGTLTINGDILAKGGTTTGSDTDWYPGAGGSVWLTAAKLLGQGTISVGGGNATTGYAAGGGAGRVAFYVTGDGNDFSGYTGEVDFSTKIGSYVAHTGTFYRETKADNGKGELWVKGYNAPTNKIPSFALKWNRYGTYVCDTNAPIEFSTIRMTGHSTLLIPSNVTVTASNFISENDATWTNRIVLMGGELKLTPDATVSNLEIIAYMPGSDLGFTSNDGSGTLRIADGGRVSPAIDMTLHGPLHIGKGGSYSHYKGCPISITVPGDCTIDEGGAVDVVGKGYATGSGPGNSTIASSGASHGGRGSGGSSAGDNAPGGNGPCYGSVTSPVTMGSGGKLPNGDSSGGGAIKLTVEGTLNVAGRISADSLNCDHYTGAGGSIWIIAQRIIGSGSITATGGIIYIGQWNASGGGGRIALYLTDESSTFDDFSGIVTAHGGGKKNGDVFGGPGSVYYKLAGEDVDEGTLVIDNGPNAKYRNFECRFDEGVTDLSVGKVIISNGSTLAVAPGKTVTFSKSWENRGGFRAEQGSSVVCNPEATASISGTNLFYNFICTAPGKTIEFDHEDSFFGVQAAGSLSLAGAGSDYLTLKSLLPGTPWLMKVDSSAAQDIKAVDVFDSDASQGALVVAEDSVGEDQRNANWRFVTIEEGAVITWTGEANSAFGDASNWDLLRTPVETDFIVIKPDGAHQPVLSADLSVAGLEILSGASLDLYGYDISVSNLTLAGTLIADERECLRVTGDADFSTGTFESKKTILSLNGGAAQTLKCGSVVFNDVFVDKDAGSLSLADSLTAERVRIKARGALSVSFAAGSTLEAREVRFDGLCDSVALLALSGVSGAKWNVKAGEYAFAAGVTVNGCDASSGLAFRTHAPSSGSNCVNWDFASAVFVWSGSEDSEFTNANNWVGGVAPDSTSSVFIENGEMITMSSPASVRDLVIGGGEEVTSLSTTAPLEVSGMFVVATNGVFTGGASLSVGGSMTVQRGGKVDHHPNKTSEEYSLDILVGGNLTLDEGGAIDVSGCGYQNHSGPGGIGLAECGPSHGGTGQIGGNNGRCASCYGSILHPSHSGTGSWWKSNASCGGGVAKLRVAGSLVVNGAILSDGIDESITGESYYAATGGSIDIECAELVGNGVISATAGRVRNERTGGGGRIAVRLTAVDTYEDSFSGVIRCYGGKVYVANKETYPTASSGTIYIQGASKAEGCGSVLIDGGGRSPSSTTSSNVEYPVSLYGDAPRDLMNATFVLRNGGTMKLTQNCTIGELEIEDTSSRLFLNGFTLTVVSHKHKKDVWSDKPSTIIAGSGGKIVFKDKGLVIIVK